MTDDPSTTDVQRLCARAGAVLVLIAFLLGIFVSGAMTGKVDADAHAALASHLNALLGGILILGVGWSMPFVHFGAVGKKRIALLFIVSNFANWIITAIKAFLHVSGVDHTGVAANDGVFVALTLFVVLPSFAASVGWLVGLFRAQSK
jgi:hydroxylaminobenzene mutase